MKILHLCSVRNSAPQRCGFLLGIRITPQFGLPNWVYPTLKMSYQLRGITFSVRGPKPYRRFISLRGVSSPLEKSRNIAPPVMKASPTRTKWLSDKVVAYASVFFSLPRPTFRRWITDKSYICKKSLYHVIIEICYLKSY